MRISPRARALPAARSRAPVHAGFTLIELLVVIAILSMLIALVGPAVMNRLGGAKSNTARIQISELAKALDIYKLDTGRYPTTAEGLAALEKKPAAATGWNGPYLKNGTVPIDPWGNAYRYTNPGNGTFEILSYGGDNASGGEGENADLRNSK